MTTKTIRFIGDVHGNFNKYFQLINQTDLSIQVGDFGVGFVPMPNLTENNRFIRGNHDDPSLCTTIKNYIPDGTFEDGIMFLGGAWSIDRAWRTEGKDWWPDEELSIKELDYWIQKYDEYRPKIMVTHDCPDVVSPMLVNTAYKTRTGQALGAMFSIHQPKLWIFGHYHISRKIEMAGTTFICLDIDEHIDVTIQKNVDNGDGLSS